MKLCMNKKGNDSMLFEDENYTSETDSVATEEAPATEEAAPAEAPVEEAQSSSGGTQIECVSCGVSFDFTSEEKAFYDEKGFSPPKRCKPCRQAAKQARRGGGGGYGGGGGGGYGGGGYGGGGSRPPRQMHDVTCAGCGCDTQVPFRPDGSRPVYCRDCYQSQKSNSYY